MDGSTLFGPANIWIFHLIQDMNKHVNRVMDLVFVLIIFRFERIKQLDYWIEREILSCANSLTHLSIIILKRENVFVIIFLLQQSLSEGHSSRWVVYSFAIWPFWSDHITCSICPESTYILTRNIFPWHFGCRRCENVIADVGRFV